MQHGRTVVVLNVRHIRLAYDCTLEAYQKMGAYIIEKVAAMSHTQGTLSNVMHQSGVCMKGYT